MRRAPRAQQTPEVTGEAEALTREMANAIEKQLAFSKRCSQSSADQPFTNAGELNPAYEDHLRHGSPEKLSFFDLSALAKSDPEASAGRWTEIKQGARHELTSGHRAAKVMEFQPHPWTRAQFLALRKEIVEDWQPRNGIETLLIDLLAMAMTSVYDWQETLTRRIWAEAECEKPKADRDGTWRPPRLTSAEAIEEAATMVDRFNRMIVRTLRALRDLRRYDLAIVVRNTGQINIAENQMNVPARRRKRRLPQALGPMQRKCRSSPQAPAVGQNQ